MRVNDRFRFPTRFRGRTLFVCQLPTVTPGVNFTVRFAVWWRRTDGRPARRRRCRLVAEHWAAKMAHDLTVSRHHDECFVVEREVNLQLGEWQTAPSGVALSVRAEARFFLAAPDAARAADYDTHRRSAHQTIRCEQDRLEHLRVNVLNEADAARRWWLDRHSSNLADLSSWDRFDQVLLPLVASSKDPQSGARRATMVLMDVVQRLEDDPRRYQHLAATAAALFREMGWPDLARKVTPGDDFRDRRSTDDMP